MDKLIAYLNSLDKASRTDFASRCGTSEGYIRKARSAKQKFRSELCVRIEQQSNGAVTRQDLRDDWADVWPELIRPRLGDEGVKEPPEPKAKSVIDDAQPVGTSGRGPKKGDKLARAVS